MKLTAKNIKKRSIFFVPEDVLFSGDVNKSVSREKVDLVLSFLKDLKSQGLIELFLISGREKSRAESEIAATGLEKFFRKENIFMLTDSYIASKEETDRERYISNLQKDPFFVDEFFKQRVLMDLIASGGILREEAVLVGHDLWLDGFYTSRFSGVDFVLVREGFSERNVPSSEIPKWVHCIDFTIDDFKSLIFGKIQKQDAKMLESYIFRKLSRELVDPKELAGMVQKVQAKRSEGESTFTDTNK
ncbi:MAG TPA: hypothetical protein VJH23_05535 [archaeon]|nr:hypothetical protein [archaeon]